MWHGGLQGWVRVVAVGGLVLALAACSGRPHRQTDAHGGGGPLKYWCGTNPSEIALAEELVKRWNAAHPAEPVRVQPIPASQSSEEVLIAAIAAGTTPDVGTIWPGVIRECIAAGGLLRLDAHEEFNAAMRERLTPEKLAQYRSHDGGWYQIPWKCNPNMLYYNVRLFREAGVEPVLRTYADYFAAAPHLTRDRNGDGRTDQWMGYSPLLPIWWQRLGDFYSFYLAAGGGRTLFDAQGQVALDTAAAAQVFGFFQRAFREGYHPRALPPGDPFLSGRAATLVAGPWFLAQVRRNAPPGFECDVLPLPVPAGHAGPVFTFEDSKSITVFSTTRNPRAAVAFACYLASAEADLLLLELTRQIPIRKGLAADPRFAAGLAADARLLKFAQQAEHMSNIDDAEDLKEIFDAVSHEFEASAIHGAKPPAAAVAGVIRRIEVIRKWNTGQ